MSRNATLATLRARIARQEHPDGHDWPIAGLGSADVDAALPGGGLATGALHEFLPAGCGHFPATLGFGFGVLARIVKGRPGHILWVTPAWQSLAEGALYPVGFRAFGIDPDRVIHVSVPKSQSVLWTLDEALKHRAVAAAVGLLPENDRAYDFTASRRLAMRAARHGATALILPNQQGFAMATAAEMRWSVAAEPSFAARRTGQSVPGLGAPRWHVRVIKSRRGASGTWRIEWDHETLSFRLAAPLADRAPVRIPGAETGQWIAA